MKTLILKMENWATWKYSLEDKRTIAIFKFTEKIRKIINFWDC